MVSNVELESALGRHIGIYPLNPDRIEGASVDLTASAYAWSVKNKKSIVSDDVISIDSGDTAIVFSNEAITLDDHYAGACYNRISFSMRGLIHASSPIKPNYTGRFSVTLYNASPDTVTIRVGDPIVVIMFHRLEKKASLSQGNGNGSRFDLLQAMRITVEDDETRNAIKEFDDREKLIRKMKESHEYKALKKRDYKRKFKIVILIAVCLAAVLTYLFVGPLRGQAVSLLTGSLSSLIGGGVAGAILLFVEYKVIQKL